MRAARDSPGSRSALPAALGLLVVGAAAWLWLMSSPETARDDVAAATDTESDPVALDAGRVAAGNRVRPPGAGALTRDVEEAPLDESGPAARAGTERAYLAELRALAARDPDGFRRVVYRVLTEGGSRARSVAALRAWLEVGATPRFGPFALVIDEAKVAPAVQDFAMRLLQERGRHDEHARRFLADYLDRSTGPRRLQREALYTVLRWGGEREVHGRRPMLYAERDLGVILRAAKALADSDTRSARLILEDLTRTHPDAGVRKRLAGLAARD